MKFREHIPLLIGLSVPVFLVFLIIINQGHQKNSMRNQTVTYEERTVPVYDRKYQQQRVQPLPPREDRIISSRHRGGLSPVSYQPYEPQQGITPSNLEKQVVYTPTVSGPHTLNIDFGVWRPQESTKTGSAATGKTGDYWNAVGVPFNDDHTEYNLKSTSGQWSPISVRLINLGGGWSNMGKMGIKDPMLDTYNYPKNNQGGNSQVILYKVPAGNYDLYIYGHGVDSLYGDYTVSIGTNVIGHKMTSRNRDAVDNTLWEEGSQYVIFQNIKVSQEENIRILIQPGERITDGSGRSFSDAMICGLQLVPADH